MKGRLPRAAGFVSDAGFATLGVFIAGATRVLSSIVVGRAGGPELLVVANAGLALALVATMLGPAAYGSAASKFIARTLTSKDGASDVRTVWHHLLRRVLVLSSLLAVGCAVAGGALLGVSVRGSLCLGVLVLALSLAALTRGASFGRSRFRLTVVAEAVNSGIALILLVGALRFGVITIVDPSLVLLPLALGSLAYAAITWPRFVRADRIAGGGAPQATEASSEMDAFALWGVLGNVASAGLLQLSLILAAASANAGDAGLYAAAVALATPTAAVAQPLAQVLFPRFASADARKDAQGVRRQTDAATRGLVVLMVLGSGIVVTVAEPLLRFAYGPEFVAAVGFLRLVAVAVLLSTLTVPAVASLTSGDPSGIRTAALMSTCGLLVGGLVAAVAVPLVGVTGAALGFAVGTATTNAVLWVLVWRRQHQHWAGLSIRIVAAVAIMGVLAVADASWSGLGVALDLIIAIGFACLWLLMSRGDIATVRRSLSR